MTTPKRHDISPEQAARFLAQAAFGGSHDDVVAVQSLGFEGWLDEQMAQPRSETHWNWLVANGYAVKANINNLDGVDNSLWRKLMSSSDVLRQRIALALSEVLVVSMDSLTMPWRGMAAAHYMDTLEAHALGNFRELLQAVTLSVGMGAFLNMRGSQKADDKGRQPDENYAREVMQLFTIGLRQLQPDGTELLRHGQPVETYTQDDIRGLAQVFTGWDVDGYNRETPDHVARPMVLSPQKHSSGSKAFLGTVLPAGLDGNEELRLALEVLFQHPNVGPFIGRQLIQRLVTSNPSPAYVGRVAAAFNATATVNANAQGVRGDLPAVVRAVLLDPEARAPNRSPGWGMLREPMVRLVQWARTFEATASTDLWSVGNQSNPSFRLGQSPLRAPSVFNFFRPGYVPPGTVMGLSGLVAPELQITNETSVVGYANWMLTVVSAGVGDVQADYSPWLPLSNNATDLFDGLNTLLAAGQLGMSSRSTITAAVDGMPRANDAQRLRRIQATVWLILCSPEYLVQK
jgi:uncharacterized protein (DUF1800 family)